MSDEQAIVHFVDDDDSFRSAVTEMLRVAGFSVREYRSAGEFLVAGVGHRPGCVLLDVKMPGPSGLDLQTALARYGIDLPVVFLTGYGDVSTTVRAMKAGALDFLEKPVEPERLIETVRDALARGVEGRTLANTRRVLRERYDHLTAREREVFAGLVAGKLNKQIASDLRAAERTIKGYRAQVLQKMQVRSVAELARVASELGLFPASIGHPDSR